VSNSQSFDARFMTPDVTAVPISDEVSSTRKQHTRFVCLHFLWVIESSTKVLPTKMLVSPAFQMKDTNVTLEEQIYENET